MLSIKKVQEIVSTTIRSHDVYESIEAFIDTKIMEAATQGSTRCLAVYKDSENIGSYKLIDNICEEIQAAYTEEGYSITFGIKSQQDEDKTDPYYQLSFKISWSILGD